MKLSVFEISMVVIIVLFSTVVHEGIHYIQYKLDPRIEPTGFQLDGLWIHMTGIMTTTDPDGFNQISNQLPYFEAQAYLGQFLFIIVAINYALNRDRILNIKL